MRLAPYCEAQCRRRFRVSHYSPARRRHGWQHPPRFRGVGGAALCRDPPSPFAHCGGPGHEPARLGLLVRGHGDHRDADRAAEPNRARGLPPTALSRKRETALRHPIPRAAHLARRAAEARPEAHAHANSGEPRSSPQRTTQPPAPSVRYTPEGGNLPNGARSHDSTPARPRAGVRFCSGIHAFPQAKPRTWLGVEATRVQGSPTGQLEHLGHEKDLATVLPPGRIPGAARALHRRG